MAFELDLTCIKIKWYTKFQIKMSKHVGEKCGKLWRTDGRTDGWTDGDPDGRMDGRTDGHHHTIIRPVWRRAYKKMDFWRYHMISEIFLTNDYRTDWRHQCRWYIFIKLVKNTFSFRKHFSTVLTEEIRIAKFCTEVFVMPKHLMTKLYIPESSLYMSPLRAIVLFQQHCRITVIW